MYPPQARLQDRMGEVEEVRLRTERGGEVKGEGWDRG